MALKEFFRPTTLKLSITGVLFLMVGLILRNFCLVCHKVRVLGVYNSFGFPFPIFFKPYSGIPMPGPTLNELIFGTFTLFLIDILIWYLIACVSVFAYFKYKKS